MGQKCTDREREKKKYRDGERVRRENKEERGNEAKERKERKGIKETAQGRKKIIILCECVYSSPPFLPMEEEKGE